MSSILQLQTAIKRMKNDLDSMLTIVAELEKNGRVALMDDDDDMPIQSLKPSTKAAVGSNDDERIKLKTMTMDQLKSLCKSRSLPVGGNKDKLISRILGEPVESVPKTPSTKVTTAKPKKVAASAPPVHVKVAAKNPLKTALLPHGSTALKIHPDTGFIFNEKGTLVINRLRDGEDSTLTVDDLEECKELGFKFVAPMLFDAPAAAVEDADVEEAEDSGDEASGSDEEEVVESDGTDDS